jgi:hypothetical protein
MAIADFFHCENILDLVVESPRFIRLVRVCRLVGEDFVVPHQKKIGGTKHMAEGGKKDVSYIADLFEEKVMEYDPMKTCADVFFFDGASNVQKAGEVLMARFPCSFCFHGGEHVVSLFFLSIAKIKPVKVSCVFVLLAI